MEKIVVSYTLKPFVKLFRAYILAKLHFVGSKASALHNPIYLKKWHKEKWLSGCFGLEVRVVASCSLLVLDFQWSEHFEVLFVYITASFQESELPVVQHVVDLLSLASLRALSKIVILSLALWKKLSSRKTREAQCKLAWFITAPHINVWLYLIPQLISYKKEEKSRSVSSANNGSTCWKVLLPALLSPK